MKIAADRLMLLDQVVLDGVGMAAATLMTITDLSIANETVNVSGFDPEGEDQAFAINGSRKLSIVRDVTE